MNVSSMGPYGNGMLLICLLMATSVSMACTNFIVTKGASRDGSTMLVYTNDGEWLYRLYLTGASVHPEGDSIEFTNRYGAKGKIAQVSHTFGVVGFHMNEFQVAVGETTFVGREELWNKSKYLEYWHLMQLALERAKTAREAVLVMTDLAEEYGYGSEGESFSVIDPEEAWLLEMVGTGDGGEGAIWVAVKIPDGCISAHANMARIGIFPLDDPENCLYSSNVISFAIQKGYYDPNSGIPFHFNQVYNPPSPERLKYCETRVWRLFSRCAPSLDLSPDYHRGVPDAERYPLWIKPDNKLSLEDVISLVRDHYEGTPYDMTLGPDAGPFGNPNRWRPLAWEVNGQSYSWERPISTFNTAFSMIAQCRSWLPDPLGGILWFGVDDTYFTCYVPIYCGINRVPDPFAIGDINKFSWDSMWWVFNLVSNIANIRYAEMIQDIQPVQKALEHSFLSDQDSLTANLAMLDDTSIKEMLTDYSIAKSEQVHEKWVSLAEHLFTKYNDGYIKDSTEGIRETGYPADWYNHIIENDPEKFRIKSLQSP